MSRSEAAPGIGRNAARSATLMALCIAGGSQRASLRCSSWQNMFGGAERHKGTAKGGATSMPTMQDDFVSPRAVGDERGREGRAIPSVRCEDRARIIHKTVRERRRRPRIATREGGGEANMHSQGVRRETPIGGQGRALKDDVQGEEVVESNNRQAA